MSSVELLPPAEANPNNPKWHKLRREGVTASEIAAILGISPWDNPFSAFWRKANAWEVEDNNNMNAGRRLEPVVADWFADLNPGLVVHPAGLYAHPDRPWQLATPDRLVCDPQLHDNPFPDDPGYHYDHNTDAWTIAVLECKAPYNWDGFGDDGTDEVPIYYRAQVLWQMDVVGVDDGYLAAYANHQLRVYRLQRDEDDLAVMREAGARFMARVQSGDPPDLDDTAATTRTLRRLHPSVEDREVDIPEDLADPYLGWRAQVQLATKKLDEYENRIRDALGSAKRGIFAGQPLVSRSVYEQRRLDSRRLRAEHPDLADQYTMTSTVDRLNCSIKECSRDDPR